MSGFSLHPPPVVGDSAQNPTYETNIYTFITVLMLIEFTKYHALQNDFLVIERHKTTLGKTRLSHLAQAICNRRAGVGADGILLLSRSRKADRRIDIYNADGSWAEKSGNGLRIAGLHEFLRNRRRKTFVFETATSLDKVVIRRSVRKGKCYEIAANLGEPEFRAARIPVKSRYEYMINVPLALAGMKLPVTCVAVGNPHAVLFVDSFNFDWKMLGSTIERHHLFPNRTNVEFAKIVNRQRIKVTVWERGVGATCSSGTGASAVVCAAVLNGLSERRCEVVMEGGSLLVEWHLDTNSVEVTGPVELVAHGTFDFQ
jgi:diaminopimelate epimerase